MCVVVWNASLRLTAGFGATLKVAGVRLLIPEAPIAEHRHHSGCGRTRAAVTGSCANSELEGDQVEYGAVNTTTEVESFT